MADVLVANPWSVMCAYFKDSVAFPCSSQSLEQEHQALAKDLWYGGTCERCKYVYSGSHCRGNGNLF